jgi:protein-L-isoaspartate(D-aspartate) O-methyltransferase
MDNTSPKDFFDRTKHYQEELWKIIVTKIGESQVERLKAAFDACPRHSFVRQLIIDGQYYSNEDLSKSPTLLANVYANRPLLVFEDSETGLWSTISQPSLVFQMLEALALKPGERVFEIGTGSGWNAALMAYLVGEEGEVVTSEIIPELVVEAKRLLQQRGHHNVNVVRSPHGWTKEELGTFDAVVFTASCREVPESLLNCLNDGGRILAVVQVGPEEDELRIGRKLNGSTTYQRLSSCRFIPMAT